jgi:predicted CopG family antitoxin
MMTRTTITIPTDLYELLRLEAYQHHTSFSGIVQKKLSGDIGKRKLAPSLMQFAGTYQLKGKTFDRKAFYDAIARRDVALGH